MASMEFLKERISKAQETIAKKQNTISKKEALINKKQNYLRDKYNIDPETFDRYDQVARDVFGSEGSNDIYWTLCDISSLKEDIRRGNKDIKEKRESLDKYLSQLNSEIEKSNSRDIKVIIEFLNNWKERCTEYYLSSYEEYSKDIKVFWEEYNKILEPYRDWRYAYQHKEENIEADKKASKLRTKFNRKWNFIYPYLETKGLDRDKLEKDLQQEADRKYDFIVERTNHIVGQITDASNLVIGEKGDLNGLIYGTKGTAEVNTIGAGGYNIQIYHFRTLIREVK